MTYFTLWYDSNKETFSNMNLEEALYKAFLAGMTKANMDRARSLASLAPAGDSERNETQ